ncbi:hypothetical protein GCM10009530_63250 [Microbispora corallina]|uniref:Secreted protein n=1 Tax=Microbispora corallina TaxID=83302 RepID=A0ABQ4GBN6_9ACTN|nr:hypothetical protein [Microbispora corallina]GIH44445.1 hypothetical protein Mco01_74450 [Microbispora corallina]
MWGELLFYTAGLTTGSILTWQAQKTRAEQERASTQAAAAALNARLEAAQRDRDSALDALSRLVLALETDGEYTVEHALDAAYWVLQGGNYTGRLRAAQQGHEEAEQELADLAAWAEAHGLPVASLDEHVDRAIAIIRDHADAAQPDEALHLIHQNITGKTAC